MSRASRAEEVHARRRLLVGYDVHGAVAIAELLGREPRWVWRMARRSHDPLPVKKYRGRRGRLVGVSDQLRAWLERQLVDVPPERPRGSSGRGGPVQTQAPVVQRKNRL